MASHFPVPIEKPLARNPARWLLVTWHFFGLGIGIAYWAFFGLGLTLLGTLLHPLLPRESGSRLGQGILHQLFRWFTGLVKLLRLVHVDATALDSLRGQGPLILAPNHAALWDAVFIISRLPRVTCVMKPSILENPFLGGGARLAGFIPGHPITRMIRAASGLLDQGGQLLYFPEGTRTSPSARWINPFRGGCALTAARSGAPVQTIFIRTDSRFLQKGWSVFRKPAFPIHVSFELGPRLNFAEGESPQQFTERLEETFTAHLSRPHPLRRQIIAAPSSRDLP